MDNVIQKLRGPGLGSQGARGDGFGLSGLVKTHLENNRFGKRYEPFWTLKKGFAKV